MHCVMEFCFILFCFSGEGHVDLEIQFLDLFLTEIVGCRSMNKLISLFKRKIRTILITFLYFSLQEIIQTLYDCGSTFVNHGMLIKLTTRDWGNELGFSDDSR